MMNFTKWVSCQLESMSLLSRPLNFFVQHPPNVDDTNHGTIDIANLTERDCASDIRPDFSATPQHVMASTSDATMLDSVGARLDPIEKVISLQIKFLRLVKRLGLSTNDDVVTQVLYRLQLASLIRSDNAVKKPTLNIDCAKAIAAKLEATDRQNLEFPLKILLLGKSGVGKSALINSIFDQKKSATNPFQPSTNHIQDITGTIKGIKVSFIDTPGLLSPSYHGQRRNRKLLHSIRHFIKKSQPDIVLYLERLDFINSGQSDHRLFKLITDIFGSSIWFNTILVFTHASVVPPEGPDGFPMSYETYANHCMKLVQHSIQKAVHTQQLENLVVFVDNHPLCCRNSRGEKILPNGYAWISQFLLLCAATKVLSAANALLKFSNSFHLSRGNTIVPSLPHLLSSFLKPHNPSYVDTADEMDQLDDDDDDDYDQLPPIRILTKSQYERLSNAQKKAYLNELDYRETLFLKKQQKEDAKRQKLARLHSNDVLLSGEVVSNNEYGSSQELAQISDVPVPLSFDADEPTYRYRVLLGYEECTFRPVVDQQVWDHDVGFSGISLEAYRELTRRIRSSVTGQMIKEKDDFSIHSDCMATYTSSDGHSLLGSLNIQTAGKNVMCTVSSDVKLNVIPWNVPEAAVSLTKLGSTYCFGGKLEDTFSVSRCKLVASGGRMLYSGQVANGGSLEISIKGRGYPVRDEKLILGATLLSFDNETVLGCNLKSDFRASRSYNMSFNANINNRGLGQISLKTSTSDHVEIAWLAFIPCICAVFGRRRSRNSIQ